MTVLFRGGNQVERRALNFPDAAQMISEDRLRRSDGISDRYSPYDALRVAGVTACVSLRAGAFAQLPIKAYRDVNGVATPLAVQPDLLRTPSDLVVPSVWKIQMSVSRDLWGYALGRTTAYDAAMYPKRVEWLDPTSVAPVFDGRRLDWRIGGEVYDGSLFVHIPSRWATPGNPVGVAPLEHSGLVELARRAQDFGRDWFRNGAVPSSIVYSDKPLAPADADSLIETILGKWRNRRPAVLGSGLKYEKISVPANESQFLETLIRVNADIALAFNMPPEKVGAAVSGSAVTYANREQNQQQYLVDSINPDLVVIQESLDRHSPRTQYSMFNTGAFLRSDLLTRYQSYEIGIRSRFLRPNEARALEEWEPIEGGDAFAAAPPPAAAVRGSALAQEAT